MEYLFVYGTLADPVIQKRLLGRVVAGVPDVLEGFIRGTVTISGREYFMAMKREGSSIAGQILELKEHELLIFDGYETEAYVRKKVMLKSGKSAWVYCAH